MARSAEPDTRARKGADHEETAERNASGRAKGAKRPSHAREPGAVSKPAPASAARSERQRAQATGIVTRRAKTASAGFVEPGGAKPRPAE